MSISARIIRLEDCLTRPPRREEFDWQPYLGRLSDQQLERLEELSIKAGTDLPENADRNLGDIVQCLHSAELHEFYELIEAMEVPQ